MSRVGIIGRGTGSVFAAVLAAKLEDAGHEVVTIGAADQLPPMPAYCHELVPERRRRSKGERKRNRGSRWS